MTPQAKNLIGVLALATSAAAVAQAQMPAQQTTSTTTQQTPNQTQTTTTNSTTTAAPGTPATPPQTQTTTTQSTTATPTDSVTGQPTGPSQSSTTTTATTSTNPAVAKPATAADVKAGLSVYDQNGGLVGKIDVVTSKGAVVNTGTVKASIPVSSFAKGDKGLVIAMTKAEIDAAAKKSTTKPK
jgi:hypothetical protein